MPFCRNRVQVIRLWTINRKVVGLTFTVQATSFISAAPAALAVIPQAATIKPCRLHLYFQKACASINNQIITRASSERDADDQSGVDVRGQNDSFTAVASFVCLHLLVPPQRCWGS